MSVLPLAIPGAAAASAAIGRRPATPPADDAGIALDPLDPDRLSSPGAGPALIALIGTFAWMLYVASVTVGYLAPAFGGAVDQVLSLIAGEEAGRELFRAAPAATSPSLEQFMALRRGGRAARLDGARAACCCGATCASNAPR